MYTGRVTISQQNVIDLIRAADLLELTSVKNETLKVIEEHISFDVSIKIPNDFCRRSNNLLSLEYKSYLARKANISPICFYFTESEQV